MGVRVESTKGREVSLAYIWCVFLAVFFAGISSLQMELSLLREATFVLGGTAFTSSFVISIFLFGLAVGAYGGSYLATRMGRRARLLFVISQLINILVVVVFVYTKGEMLYGRHERWEVLTYFGGMTLGPSVIAGMAFSLFLNMLYGKGEKYIAMVYAVSTIGNVLSGFIHGMVLVPVFGMAATYMTAVTSAGLAILFILGTGKIWRPLVGALGAGTGVAAIAFAPPFTAASPYEVLFNKHDIHGLVQVVDRSEDWTSYDGGPAIDLRINNRHQCATRASAVAWEFKSVDRAMRILGGEVKTVLNAGYCSGASVYRLLDYPTVEKVISVDMNKTVLEAAAIYFPEFHERNLADPRSEIVIAEFRSYLKSLPEDQKFDIVVIDISSADPYFHGIFTREFFAEIKAHMSDRAVVFWHRTDFLRTGAEVFDYVYRSRSERFRSFHYFTTFELPRSQLEDFERVYPERRKGVVYEDHDVHVLEAGARVPR